jgi:antitoxin component YwqK of YwqJK toxin-antitoxin module
VEIIYQSRSIAPDTPIPHGIWVELYEDGNPKRFADYHEGRLDGLEVTWDPEGAESSRRRFRQGMPTDPARDPQGD